MTDYAGRIIEEWKKHAAASDELEEQGKSEDSAFHAFMANAIYRHVLDSHNEDLKTRFREIT